MKLNLFTLAIVLLTSFTLKAQKVIKFEETNPIPVFPDFFNNFEGSQLGSIDYSDIDGDNDLDVIITGAIEYPDYKTTLYINQNSGIYTKSDQTIFEDVAHSSIAFADIDDDNDYDILITGVNNNLEAVAKLYMNDGDGNFYIINNTPFEGVSNGKTSFADIDNDGDQDLIIAGENNSFSPSIKLYTNDGNGTFIETENTIFSVFSTFYTIDFADLDNDNDLDLFITGENNSYEPIVKQYSNDGNGNFQEITVNSFTELTMVSTSISNLNEDAHLDITIIGVDETNHLKAIQYTGDGNGNFAEQGVIPLTDFRSGIIEFADIDGDNDQDIIINGQNDANEKITKLYKNEGIGTLTEITETPFIDGLYDAFCFVDIDGDNDYDLISMGGDPRFTYLYENGGDGNYTEVLTAPYSNVYTSLAMSDFNGDNFNDIIIAGWNRTTKSTKLYMADIEGNISENTASFLKDFLSPEITLVDVDNDSDVDIFISGRTPLGEENTVLYLNDGSASFTESAALPFSHIGGIVKSSDFDGDTDMDIIIMGMDNNTETPTTMMFLNNGGGDFSEVTNISFNGVVGADALFFDMDNDNDNDLIICGYADGFENKTWLYTNDGSGNFTEISNAPFENFSNGAIAAADIDNDNDLDVLITGLTNNPSSSVSTKLYKNNGNGEFTEATENNIEGVKQSSIAFADFDDDNDMDLIVTGSNISNEPINNLYTNDGNGIFTLVNDLPLKISALGSIAVADMNNDNEPDLIFASVDTSGYRNIAFYENTSCIYSVGTDVQTACDSFTWIDGITYTESNDIATYIIPNAIGCDSIITLNLTINTVNVDIENTDSTITALEENATYQWINCENNSIIEGATERTFQPAITGNYAVIITANDCIDTSECVNITVTNIHEYLNNEKILIYPNPTTGVVAINFEDFQIAINKIERIIVTDINGKVVFNETSVEEHQTIDLSGLSNGIYFIKIITQTENYVNKIIKQ